MGFREDTQRAVRAIRAEQRAIVADASRAFYNSVRDGSPITGAPGQPRRTDELYDSWKYEETPTGAVISSASDHAMIVEDNIRGARFHNGGPHSLKLSMFGFGRLLEQAAAGRK